MAGKQKVGTMITRRFWIDTFERCVGTFFAAMVATLGAGAAGITGMPWLTALNLSAGATTITLFKCLLSAGVGPADSASLFNAVGSKTTTN